MKLKMTKEIVIKSKFKRNAKFHQGVMHNVNVTIRKINRNTPPPNPPYANVYIVI